MRTVKLTPAQQSAIECSGAVAEPLEAGEHLLIRCLDLRRGVIEFEEADRDTLISVVIEMANSEDAVAEICDDLPCRRSARGACRALSNLVSKL